MLESDPRESGHPAGLDEPKFIIEILVFRCKYNQMLFLLCSKLKVNLIEQENFSNPGIPDKKVG